jgi:hypothetical protein
MGLFNDIDPIFFYHKSAKPLLAMGFNGVVTPSVAIAYTWAIFQGIEFQKKQVQKYVSRRYEPIKKYRRRSTFGVGFDGEQWVDYLDRHSLEIQQLMKLTRNKRRFYQQGIRAATLIRSIS